jgi:hypothetical protein
MRKPRIVVLGGMTKMPVAGIVFITVQYLLGLKRLGCDVVYAEAESRWPAMLMQGPADDAWVRAAGFIDATMRRFDLGADRWSLLAIDEQDRYFGLSRERLERELRDADFVFNLHGGTLPRPEHYASGRLVYVGTDPVEREVDVFNGESWIIEYLDRHCAFFTWGENHGAPDCLVPVSDRFHFVPTRQPIVMDLWQPFSAGPADTFTTIGNWKQRDRPVVLRGETYHWSKHLEFLKVIDLPRRCEGQPFELALSSLPEEDRSRLDAHGWRVAASMDFTLDLDAYRAYIGRSRGEFTVAKDQNVRLRSGWFSDRSAAYLACGRPVITQETGFSNVLPTGEGLFAFESMSDIEAAVAAINANYDRHSAAARAIARECFDSDLVLRRMLETLGVRVHA